MARTFNSKPSVTSIFSLFDDNGRCLSTLRPEPHPSTFFRLDLLPPPHTATQMKAFEFMEALANSELIQRKWISQGFEEWRQGKEHPWQHFSWALVVFQTPLLSVTITHCFLSFLSIYLCLLFVLQPVNCSSPIDCIPFSYLILSSWSQNYPFNTRIFFLEYSIVLLIVLSLSSTFFCLVILLIVEVYKSHSSPLLFFMLVYFVPPASIHLLLAPLDLSKSSSYFWVDTFSLNPWILEATLSELLCWDASTTTCVFTQEEPLIPQSLRSSLPGLSITLASLTTKIQIWHWKPMQGLMCLAKTSPMCMACIQPAASPDAHMHICSNILCNRELMMAGGINSASK